MTVRVRARDSVTDRLLCDALQARVDRQLELAIRALPRDPPQRADDVSARVHRHERTRDAAVQRAVIRRFDTRLADDLSRVHSAVAALVQLAWTDLPEQPQELAADRAVRIPPLRDLDHLDAAEGRGAFLEEEREVARNVLKHDRRCERIANQAAAHVCDELPHRNVRESRESV